jgi:CRISPR-associated endoribonuclease Cas6
MRVKLTLFAQQRGARLPVNYNHAIGSLVYDTLGNDSAEFAARLHDEGFDANGRKFKLFTFSRIEARHGHIIKDELFLDDPEISLQVSSPVGEFVEHFVAGLFQSEGFKIADAHFSLKQAETVAAPAFSESMSFRALSPITESVRDDAGGVRFLSTDDDWSEIMQRNLLRKYQALYGRAPADDRLSWNWDREYLAETARRGRRASALIDIRGIKVRGWLVPFTVEGSTELIELGYEAGFGSRNSMGFGMAG